ncbi:subtilisin inhibitor-like [Saccharopolyspora erythraea NRRL 2338]|uniref:Streptomyces subtilisin inhibitor-like protein n=2 Tax=Saccharopolyspora erythraea TaxID=1836 RepID=A4F7M4_SACEN|nr:subtilase-type protease inhibitor [Saccharopolyspora erythraea]EQD87082.1 protease inhibitor [Saccharopolyspora erythraea D]PFG93852.1 subtilisin inhibitor-like [Saccharopolyspora erythraea NRRL 2338]QRK90677.1 subtilase-type protease inhibitor [Saccharopolyspora erythraea]CAM00048.1 putative Streptomyces subtilisin inhibitor-like protein [Saccharopolyspora erythraea NRRL 2338]
MRAAIRLTGRLAVASIVFAVAALIPLGANAETGPTKVTLTAQQLGAPLSVAVLTCEPSGGTHPRAEDACAVMSATGGMIEEMPAQNPQALCPLIWRPVGVTATGLWNGKPIEYAKTFANDCVMRSQLGVVFDF